MENVSQHPLALANGRKKNNKKTYSCYAPTPALLSLYSAPSAILLRPYSVSVRILLGKNPRKQA
jgi:hypothetical protein